jgi:hypothetical protein
MLRFIAVVLGGCGSPAFRSSLRSSPTASPSRGDDRCGGGATVPIVTLGGQWPPLQGRYYEGISTCTRIPE